jgi:hypothetical protein
LKGIRFSQISEWSLCESIYTPTDFGFVIDMVSWEDAGRWRPVWSAAGLPGLPQGAPYLSTAGTGAESLFIMGLSFVTLFSRALDSPMRCSISPDMDTCDRRQSFLLVENHWNGQGEVGDDPEWKQKQTKSAALDL